MNNSTVLTALVVHHLLNPYNCLLVLRVAVVK